MAQTINLDVSQRVDIVCRRGDTFSLTLTYTKDDGTGDANFVDDDVFLLQVRDADTNDSSTILSLDGVADASEKTITFTKSAGDMKTVASGLYVYDAEQKVINNSDGNALSTPTVTTLLHGTFKINEDVSITA